MNTGKPRPFPLSLRQIKNAANIHRTPLYLYDLETIDQQFFALENHLPDNFTIHYAFKANSNLAICKRMERLGSNADISSIGELYAAKKAGFSPPQLVFTGPGKTNEELLIALKFGCGIFIIESLNEARRINHLAGQLGIAQDVLLRINPLYRTIQSCEISQVANPCGSDRATDKRAQIQLISQQASKFGVDEERASEEMNAIRALPNLRLKGIHVFTESNVLDYSDLLASWRNTVRIADELRAEGHPVSHIDFGGGIGIPYDAFNQPFDMASFGREVQEIFDKSTSQYKCLVEIGRYIVGGTGCYVTQVVDIKESRGTTFVILNGGIHQLFRISPSMVQASKFLDVIGKNGQSTKEVTLAGKLPTALDVFVEGVEVPDDIAIGDQLVIYNCGAYGFNHSIANFNLHPYPAEAAYNDGQLRLIRKRGSVKDFFVHQEESMLEDSLTNIL